MKSYIAVCFLLGVASALPWDREETRSGTRAGTSCNCGWVNRGRIVGGKETQKNEYPLVVALEQTRSRFAFCGGSIITPWHVLTAAHCTINKRAADITIHVGLHHKTNSPGKRIRIAKIIQHAGYNHEDIVNDISLLVTAEQIQFNQNIGPVCMPTQRLNLVGQTIKALGWGRTSDGGSASNALMEVDLKVIDFPRCSREWERNHETPREATNMCTYEVRKDTCQGDSGGPLIWLDPATNRYTLVALVSYGGTCGGRQAAVNTDVTAFASWVHSNIASSKPGVKACTKA